jgi:hypothetical protein
MRDSLEAMKTALRVLTAICEKRQPDPADVQDLRHYAPLLAHCPIDEVACEVIHQSLRICAGIRPAGTSE